MSAGRLTDEENPVGVDGVLLGVGMEPPDGTEDILVAGRGRGTTDQPVFNRHGEEAETRPLADLDGTVRILRLPEPAASVDRKNNGKRPVAFGVGDVGQ